MIDDFNATVETTFLWLYANVNYVFNAQYPTNYRRVINFAGDILHYNMSGCDRPDHSPWAIFKYSSIACLCLGAFAFQLTLIGPFYRMTRTNGPAFFFLLTLLLCSSVNIIFTQFLLYFEAAIARRLPIPYDLDLYLRMPFWRAETLFYCIFALNRCACLYFPFNYSRVFSKRNVFWIIFWAWIYSFVENAERLMANKGMHRVHCLGANDQLDDHFQTHDVIRHPAMVVIERASEYIYYMIWFGPAVIDCMIVAKLVKEKFQINWKRPWIVIRPINVKKVGEAKNERIRMFLVCLCISVCHLLFAILFFGHNSCRWPRTFYNLFYIVENSMPYLLMLTISRDVRRHWRQINGRIIVGICKNGKCKFKWPMFSRTCRPSINRVDHTPAGEDGIRTSQIIQMH